jgi:hypothetical protein
MKNWRWWTPAESAIVRGNNDKFLVRLLRVLRRAKREYCLGVYLGPPEDQIKPLENRKPKI